MERGLQGGWLGRQLALLVLSLPFLACASPDVNPQRGDAPVARAAGQAAPAHFRPMTVMPVPVALEESATGTPLAALSGRNTPTQEVLLTLFKDSDLNLLIDPDVQGAATYDIKGTTVEHAFDSLTRYLDLAYEFEGDFVRVRRHEDRTFHLDLISAGGEGTADLWGLVKSEIPELVGEDGKALVNAVAGTVQVRAKPSAVRRVESYLDTLFHRASGQVTIEARVLEVRLRDEFRLGVNWQLLGGLLSGDYTGALGGGQWGALGASAGGDAMRFGILKTDDFSVFIDALEGQGQVRVLSSPRVSTMNNVPATLKVVDQIPVIEREIIDSEGGVRTQFDIRFVEAGITLDVTPQVGSDQHITVQVKPVITEQTGTVTTPDGLQTEPILSTREANSILRVGDGQAMVIGGLRFLRKDETSTGVPGTSRLPFLGGAGRNQVQQAEEVELVVMLIPRILTPTWSAEHHRRSASTIRRVRRCFLPSTIHMDHRGREDYKCGFLMGDVRCALEAMRQQKHATRPLQVPANSRMTITRQGFGSQLFRRGVQAFADGAYRDALARLDQAIALDGTNVDAWVYAGLAHYRLGQRDQADRRLARALRLRPDDAVALSVRGVLELERGAPAAARVLLERAQRLNPNAVTGNNLASAYIALGNVEAAVAVLGMLPIDQEPLPEAQVNLAYVLAHQGRLPEARIALTRALEQGASHREARVRLVQRKLGLR